MREQAIKSETGFHIDELDGIWYLSGCPKKEYRLGNLIVPTTLRKCLKKEYLSRKEWRKIRRVVHCLFISQAKVRQLHI